MGRDQTGRTLQTARSALQVLKMLMAAEGGLRSQDVARALSKSTSTAIYLLNSLCNEGFAVHDQTDGRYYLISDGNRIQRVSANHNVDLTEATQELYGRTNERSYLATVDQPVAEIRESRGRQGLPYVPGLARQIGPEAHALAVGKVVLAYAGNDAVGTYQDAYGLTAYTPNTVVGPEQLEGELAKVRGRGYAVDREEYAEGFCCLAAPVFNAEGHLSGVLALSTTKTRFDKRVGDLIPKLLATTSEASQITIDQ